MEKLKLVFYKCIQDSQEYGSNNEHMVSRIFFSIEENKYECNVRQPYGENFSFEENPIEVESPEELKKVINYGQFRNEVEKYFRNLVGNNASMIKITGNSNVRMKNNTFLLEYSTVIDKVGISGGW